MTSLYEQATGCGPMTLFLLCRPRRKINDVYKICKKFGWSKERGITVIGFYAAAVKLGLYLKSKRIKGHLSLAKLRKKYNKGTYMVAITGHATILHNGKIIDLYKEDNEIPTRRKVIKFWEVNYDRKKKSKVSF